jgi:hypothetical protein
MRESKVDRNIFSRIIGVLPIFSIPIPIAIPIPIYRSIGVGVGIGIGIDFLFLNTVQLELLEVDNLYRQGIHGA